MPIERPYRRMYRQFTDGKYHDNPPNYFTHPMFASSPESYLRGFLIIEKDIRDLFDYIEPSVKNISCYSYRTHALLLRTCVEFEANCKAILKEHGYSKSRGWTMVDYKKIEKTHLLSQYEVRVPLWDGEKSVRRPFSTWSSGRSLPWYDAYNNTKHDRHSKFSEANFGNLIDACCGLLAILSAQFYREFFLPGAITMSGGDSDGMVIGIGNYFMVRFPTDWPRELQYDFDWGKLKDEPDPFQTFDYSKIS